MDDNNIVPNSTGLTSFHFLFIFIFYPWAWQLKYDACGWNIMAQ